MATRPGSELSNAHVVRQLYDDFADVGELETHVIDVDDLPVDQVAAEVTRRLRSGALDL